MSAAAEMGTALASRRRCSSVVMPPRRRAMRGASGARPAQARRTLTRGRFAGLVLLLALSLAPSTDSFQLQCALSALRTAYSAPWAVCSRPAAGSSFAVLAAEGRAALRSAEAATALRAGAADFVLDTFDPEEEEDELSNENLLKILYSETTDQHVNDVVWRALGEHRTCSKSASISIYQFIYSSINLSIGYVQKPDGTYSNEKVFPKWREKYPEPPDVIGVKRNYTYAIDRPSQKANQALVASIPQDHKQVQILKSQSSVLALHKQI